MYIHSASTLQHVHSLSPYLPVAWPRSLKRLPSELQHGILSRSQSIVTMSDHQSPTTRQSDTKTTDKVLSAMQDQLQPEEQGSCRDFCCSKFATFNIGQTISHIPELTNTIHPLFRKQNFHPFLNYEVLKPCLRLASQLLQSTALVPYINALFDGEVRGPGGHKLFDIADMQPLDATVSYSIWPGLNQENVTRKSKKRAKQILYHLASMVEFDARNLAPGTLGVCTWSTYTLPEDIRQTFPHGCASKISLSANHYAWLADTVYQLSKVPQGTMVNHVGLFHHLFGTARTLCHEVGHALTNAAYGAHKAGGREINYKNAKAAEVGFDLETQLFGGLIMESRGGNSTSSGRTFELACTVGRQLQAAPTFHLQSWPSYSQTTSYQQKYGTELSSGSHIPHHDMVWTIPDSSCSSSSPMHSGTAQITHIP